MTLQDIWQEFAGEAGVLATRPDFRFDAAYYLQRYGDIRSQGLDPLQHFQDGGQVEGRLPNLYWQTVASKPAMDRSLIDFITHPGLRDAMVEGVDGAAELAFELISLGEPVDRRVSNFSSDYYFALYPDVKAAGISAFMHYLNHGAAEGRRSLGDLLQHQHEGRRAFDPARPTCMICVHELSKTGAPIVGRDIVRSAAETHNVVVASLRGGVLLEAFRDEACVVIVSDRPAEEMGYFSHPALDAVSFAVLNSVECFSFQKLLVSRDIPSAHYLHEYTEYTRPASKLAITTLFADLLVFSSEQVRASWRGVFADENINQERDTIIVPQHDLEFGAVSQGAFDKARASLSRAIGRDCTGKRVIFGAGHAQWRKGTDLFVMTAQIAAEQDPDSIYVWIGDGLNHEDVYFGTWIDKHMVEAGANDPGGNLFFIPAGPEYHNVCRAADAMFLSSRLDPLPNVVFDATRFGCRVVLFADASGFDDPMYTDGGVLETVAYGDVIEAAAALSALPVKAPGKALGNNPADQGSVFERIRAALLERVSARRRYVIGGGGFDAPVAQSMQSGPDDRRKERQKIWSYDRRWVWRSVNEARHEIEAANDWAFEKVEIAPPVANDLPAYNLHIHATETDALAAELRNFPTLRQAERVVVTVADERLVADVEGCFGHAGVEVETLVMKPRGRDVLPFLSLFHTGVAAGEDEIWAHVHTREAMGDQTRAGLTRDALLQGLFSADGALAAMTNGVGLSAPFSPYMIDWGATRGLIEEWAPRLSGPVPARPLVFPVSNMMIVRGRVAAEMARLFGADYPWPNEPMPDDGTVVQLIERLWPLVARCAGYGAVFVEPHDELVEDVA